MSLVTSSHKDATNQGGQDLSFRLAYPLQIVKIRGNKFTSKVSPSISIRAEDVAVKKVASHKRIWGELVPCNDKDVKHETVTDRTTDTNNMDVLSTSSTKKKTS